MRYFAKTISLFGLSLFAISCAEIESSNLNPPPQEFSQVSYKAAPMQISFNPKVDVLFVLDNSFSMDDELGILRRNIRQFTSSFSDNPLIDFHIGVVTVHDSSKYKGTFQRSKYVPTSADESAEKSKERDDWERQVFKYDPNCTENCEKRYRENGELVEFSGRHFVTSENYQDLESFFDLDTSFVARNQETLDADTGEITFSQLARGPEIEEAFSPVLEALTRKPLLRSTNKGFHRSDSHLAIVFITDANDSSSEALTPEVLLESVLRTKKDSDISLLSAYGVICSEGDKRCRNLKNNNIDTIEDDPKRIREFINLVDNKRSEAILAGKIEDSGSSPSPIMNLRSSNWGQRLGQIGDDIRKRTLEKRISLNPNIPEFNLETELPEISVSFGGVEVPYDENVGWTYDAGTNSITIHDGINLDQYETGSGINIRIKKVNQGATARPL